jgi:hypothetical protein
VKKYEYLQEGRGNAERERGSPGDKCGGGRVEESS